MKCITGTTFKRLYISCLWLDWHLLHLLLRFEKMGIDLAFKKVLHQLFMG